MTYHSNQVDGLDYASNDHLALASDLHSIRRSGWTIITLKQLVEAVIRQRMDSLPRRSLAITFDDGSYFDWYDLEHPVFGMQRSFASILREFVHSDPVYSGVSGLVTSFVIVSPRARECLDQTCLIGQGWWGDEWWPIAQAEGLFSIQNHSWDHKHPGVAERLRYGSDYGSFQQLRDSQECDWQIAQAQAYLVSLNGAGTARYFAYPYGDCPDILAYDYLPGRQQQTGLMAAFSTEPEPVTAASNRWLLPRYVCRRDWSSESELMSLLNSLKR